MPTRSPSRERQEVGSLPAHPLTSRLARDGAGRKGRTRRVHAAQTHVPGEAVVVARCGLIPDIDACSRGKAVGLLNPRIADGHVPADAVVGGGWEHDDAVRVTHRGVRVDQIVVTGHDADAKVGCRAGCVAVPARLVPPERVIAPLDSYAAARVRGLPVPDRHVRLNADLRRRRIDPNPRHAVRGRRDGLYPSSDTRHEEDAVRLEPLHDAGTTNTDVGLPICADTDVRSDRRALASNCRIDRSRDGEPVQTQDNVRGAERDARATGHGAGDVTHEPSIL